MASQRGSDGRRGSLLAPWERSRQKSITSFFSSQGSGGGRRRPSSSGSVSQSARTRAEAAVSTSARMLPATRSIASPVLFSGDECEPGATSDTHRSEDRLPPPTFSVAREGGVDCQMDSNHRINVALGRSLVDEPQSVATGRMARPPAPSAASVRDTQRLLRQVNELVFCGSLRCDTSACPAVSEGERCLISPRGDRLAYQRLSLSCDFDLRL